MTYEGEIKITFKFSEKTLRLLGVDEKIILKPVLEKQHKHVKTGMNWLRLVQFDFVALLTVDVIVFRHVTPS